MRAIAIISAGVFLLAATQQTNLPAPLTRHYATLAAAPSITVEYTVQPIGEAAAQYKLVLSKPGDFKLTTPTGYVVSDGKTVTTYTTLKKTYSEATYNEAWLADFSKKPEFAPWAAFLAKDPAADVVAARAGAARAILGNDTTEVAVDLKKGTGTTTYFIDKKLGVARGALVKVDSKEVLVRAKTVEIGKAPVPEAEFAFVAPEGAKKEEPTVTFAQIQMLSNERCMPCHNAQNMRANINLTTYEGIVAIVTPGKPADSLYVKSIKGVGAMKMPKNRPSLSEGEIKAVEAWILAGAKKE